jgi:hypothetical protein
MNRENQSTRFYISDSCAIYEIMSENLKPERPQMTVWRIGVEYWISKTTRVQPHAHALAYPHTSARAHTQKCAICNVSHDNSGFANTPQYYVIHTLPVLLRCGINKLYV